jgi:hypothetical protein
MDGFVLVKVRNISSNSGKRLHFWIYYETGPEKIRGWIESFW